MSAECLEPRHPAPALDGSALERHPLFRCSPDPCVVLAGDSGLCAANAAFERAFCLSADDRRHSSLRDLVHPVDREELATIWPHLDASEQCVTFECRCRVCRGQYRWFVWTFIPERNEGLIYAIARDATRHKQDEERYRERDEQISALVDMLPIVIYSVDLRTNVILTMKGAVRELFGLDADQIIADASIVHRIVHPEDVARAAEAFQTGLASRRPFELELRIVRPSDHRTVWLHERVVPVSDVDGVLVRQHGVIVDISERKQQEEVIRQTCEQLESQFAARTVDLQETNTRLRREIADRVRAESSLCLSEERFRRLIESLPVVVYSAMGGTDGFLVLDGAVEAVLGYSAEAIQAGPDIGARSVYEEDKPYFGQGYADGLRSGRPFELEYRFVRGDDGRIVWLHSSIVPAVDEDGTLLQHHGIVYDVTQRREAEEALRAYQEKLHEAQRLASLGTLAAGIAHEINNPVGAILACAENALESAHGGAVDPLVARNLTKIVELSDRCRRIVQGILQFARNEKTITWSVRLDQIVRGCLHMVEAYAQQHAACIDLYMPDAPILVQGNPIQLEQVFINVLRNAIESREQSVHVQVDVTVQESVACCTIADNGRGMTAEERRRVVDPFYTTRRWAGGTGLGMSIVHGIVTHHGGTIRLDSTPGQGTTVVIELPVKSAGSPRA